MRGIYKSEESSSKTSEEQKQKGDLRQAQEDMLTHLPPLRWQGCSLHEFALQMCNQ